MEALDTKAIYQAVLLQAVKDLTKSSEAGREARLEVEQWIGACPQPGFVEVCEMAELDAARVFETLAAIIALPLADREKALSVSLHGGARTRKRGPKRQFNQDMEGPLRTASAGTFAAMR